MGEKHALSFGNPSLIPTVYKAKIPGISLLAGWYLRAIR
jgi:hypothetical protein